MDKIKELQAKKDAKRWAESMMDYGEGSRIRRRNLERELRRKRRDREYDNVFVAELDRLDDDKVFETLQGKKSMKSAVKNAQRVYRKGKRIYRLYKENQTFFDAILDMIGFNN